MADFSVGKVGTTFFLAANTTAAKELCNKHIPSGELQAGPSGALAFPLDKESLLLSFGRHILNNGLSMEDMK